MWYFVSEASAALNQPLNHLRCLRWFLCGTLYLFAPLSLLVSFLGEHCGILDTSELFVDPHSFCQIMAMSIQLMDIDLNHKGAAVH